MENPLAKLVPQFFGDYPKQFLDLYNQVYVPPELNKDEIKILWTFCSSLILISFKLCADPIIIKFGLIEYER